MKTKIVKTIFFTFIFYLFLSNSLICENRVFKYEIKTEQAISDSVSDSLNIVSDPIYDFIIFELYGYYRNYYKYPDNMDTFVNYLYYKSLYLDARDLGRDPEDIENKLEQLKQKVLPISIKDMRGLSMSQIVFNYCYVNKDKTQFIYEEDFIVLVCGADSIYLTYKKQDVCIDRYGNDYNLWFRFIPPSERIRFYNNTGQIVFIDSELIHALYKSLLEIINIKYRKIWTDDESPVITAILKYDKKDGLSSFCPDDNIDLKHDPFFIEVRNVLDNFIYENKDIYEIIIPLKCCESKRRK
jgi:hypothetical protein